MEADHIRPFQKLFMRESFNVATRFRAFTSVGNDSHPERRGDARNRPTYRTESNNPEGFPRQFSNRIIKSGENGRLMPVS